MGKTDYFKSLEYEIIMCHAYGRPANSRNGTSSGIFNSLLLIERGEGKRLGSHEKNTNKVKFYLERALRKLSKKIKQKSHKEKMLDLTIELKTANNSTNLSRVIKQALEIWRPYKEN